MPRRCREGEPHVKCSTAVPHLGCCLGVIRRPCPRFRFRDHPGQAAHADERRRLGRRHRHKSDIHLPRLKGISTRHAEGPVGQVLHLLPLSSLHLVTKKGLSLVPWTLASWTLGTLRIATWSPAPP